MGQSAPQVHFFCVLETMSNHWLTGRQMLSARSSSKMPSTGFKPLLNTEQDHFMPMSQDPLKSWSLRTQSDKPGEKGFSALTSCKCRKAGWLAPVTITHIIWPRPLERSPQFPGFQLKTWSNHLNSGVQMTKGTLALPNFQICLPVICAHGKQEEEEAGYFPHLAVTV